MKLLFIVLIALTMKQVLTDPSTPHTHIDYCKVFCTNDLHTMCKWPTEKPGPACNGNKGDRRLTSQEKEDLLDYQNKLRDNLASGKETRTQGGPMPKAANMGALVWSEQLAQIAQRWAQQCNPNNMYDDGCRDIPWGQQVNGTWKQKEQTSQISNQQLLHDVNNLTSMMQKWYNQVTSYNAKGVNSFVPNINYGQFTFLMWGPVYQMGCGISEFTTADNNELSIFLTCNYVPAADRLGHPVYEQGEPCSKCPKGTTCGGDSRYPHLCSADEGKYPESVATLVPNIGAAAEPRRIFSQSQLLFLVIFTVYTFYV